jgi:hypothetical protein
MRFLPKLHVRSLEFLERYGAETDPVFLTGLLYNNLRNPETQNLVHILVAVDQQDQVVCHTISYIDQYQALGAVCVQMQTDLRAHRGRSVPFATKKEIRELGLKLIEEWVRSLKIKTVIAYALKPSIARLDERDGFRQFRIVLRKDLED